MHIYIIMHSLYKAVSQNVWLWSMLKCKIKLENCYYILKSLDKKVFVYMFFLCRTFLNCSNYSECHRHIENE